MPGSDCINAALQIPADAVCIAAQFCRGIPIQCLPIGIGQFLTELLEQPALISLI